MGSTPSSPTMLTLLIIFLFFLVAFLFTSKKLSPIPYFPTNKKDLPLIIKALNLQNSQTVIDLGAGDGIVIFEAAREAFEKKLNTKFVAVEINPILVAILHLQRIFHPNKSHINIILKDLFRMTMKQFNHATVYLYISPWLMDNLYKKLKSELKSFNLVSYFYPLPKEKPTKIVKGIHKIFVYDKTTLRR